jgi:hypothetical protein
MRHLRFVVKMLLVWLAVHGLVACAHEPSFELDVVPILSKAGCNGGGCHHPRRPRPPH